MTPDRPDDRAELLGLVETWWDAVRALLGLLRRLPADQFSQPTDLAGWDVHAVVAHVAHLESVLAGGPESTLDVGEPVHVRGPLGRYCEQGVVARRDRTPGELAEEIRTAATRRVGQLRAHPPRDGSAPADRVPGGTGWSWRTLLRNRPLDIWMHEQDVRRAVDLPGGTDTDAALHAVDYLLESLGFVLAKGAGAGPGTTLVVTVDGHTPAAVAVGEDRRGRALPAPPADPDTSLAMDRATFAALAGGRREASPGAVRVDGDPELAGRVLAAMAVTP